MNSKIKNMLSAFSCNMLTMIKNFKIKRSSEIILMGAWMGTKFADNSRYLYQYLFKNKEMLGIKRVVWVTRNYNVKELLEKMGYEVYIIGSKESDYWHLKAGIHIICNAAYDLTGFQTDIDSKLSFGAKKIQLWHGVGGIKAIGGASNKAKESISKDTILKRIIHSHVFNELFTIGGWGEAHIMATGLENAFCNIEYSRCREDRIFISGYPRNCECIKYTPREQEFFELLKQYKDCFLYLPTFRSDSSHFVHPLHNRKLVEFIKNNNCLWIEKPHTADLNNDAIVQNIDNVFNMEPAFDVNTIYQRMTCIITDYSSVSFDAIHQNIPLAIYAPDIEQFKNSDVGFIIDFEKVFEKMLCTNSDGLYQLIEKATLDNKKYLKDLAYDYKLIDKYAFDNKNKTYNDIWNDICSLKK